MSGGVSGLNYLRVKIFELLIWLVHQAGYKSKLHRLQCPFCAADAFMIDSYLSFYLDCAPDVNAAAPKLDLGISDAVIMCQHCGEEVEIKGAAVELIKLIVSSGAKWL
jgi:Zn finger protein HypA/HybF involved in hydrogenase expression